MVAFNAWYYSFSPYVASYLATHLIARAAMRGILYPVIGVLLLSQIVFSVLETYSEFAVVLSGLIASSLVGALYLGLPIGVLGGRFRRIRRLLMQESLMKALMVGLLIGLSTLVIGELLSSTPLLTVSSTAVILSTLCLSGLAVATEVTKKLVT